MDHTRLPKSLPKTKPFFCFCFKCCVCNCFCHFLSPLVLVLRQILLHQMEEDIPVSPLVIQLMTIIGQFHNRIKICYPNQAGLLGAFKLFVGSKCMTLSCFALSKICNINHSNNLYFLWCINCNSIYYIRQTKRLPQNDGSCSIRKRQQNSPLNSEGSILAV